MSFCSITIAVKKDDKIINEVVISELGKPPFLEAHKFLRLFETNFEKSEENVNDNA